MSATHYNTADLESGYIQTHFALRLPLWFLSNPAGKTRQKCSFSSSGSPKSHSRCVREFLVFYSSSGADMQSVNVAIFSPFPANHLRFAYVIIITRSSSSSAYRKYSSSALEEGLQKHCPNDKTLNTLIVPKTWQRGKDCKSECWVWKRTTDNIQYLSI